MSLPAADTANTHPIPPPLRRILASRWLQPALYAGLIVAQSVYVWHFWVELSRPVEGTSGSQAALQQLVTSIDYKSDALPTGLNEMITPLVVLALIDGVMIANLLSMVIVAG